jgi:hypothetical protein
MQCQFCGNPIAEPEEAPTATVECGCGYTTLFERGEVPVPLGDLIREIAPARHDLLSDTDDPVECRRRFQETFRLVIDRSHDLVAADPVAARHAVWRYLEEFESVSKRFRRGDRREGAAMTIVGRATQALVGSLFAIDTAPAFPGEPSGDLAAFVRLHSEMSGNIHVLGVMADNIRTGLVVARMSRGTLHARKTDLHSRLQEWLLNRDRLWKRSRVTRERDDIFNVPSTQAQTEWLGFSPDEGRRLFEDRHQRLREAAAAISDSAYAIPQWRCDEDTIRLFDALLLTPERVRRFSEPFYWDLGIEEPADEGHDLLFRLARHNWLNYYPVLPFDSEQHGPGYLVSAEALTYALSNLETFKGRLLERVYAAAQTGRISKAAVHRIGRLRTQANRTFENVAARLAAESGFQVATSITTCAGAPLQHGEIDLLFACEGGGTLVVGIAEVKDFDVTLHRPHTIRSLQQKVADAEAQLARKAREAARVWPSLLRELASPPAAAADVRVVAALITSHLLPAFVQGRYPVIALEAWPEFLTMLRERPDSFPPRFVEAGMVRVQGAL